MESSKYESTEINKLIQYSIDILTKKSKNNDSRKISVNDLNFIEATSTDRPKNKDKIKSYENTGRVWREKVYKTMTYRNKKSTNPSKRRF